MKFSILVSKSTCIGCGECVDICPKNIFTLNKKIALPENIKKCIGCKICEKVCPTHSIIVRI